MINEIERKFLVKELKDETKNSADSIKSIEQAYIGEGDNFIQRIRTSASFKNNSALLIGIPDKETAFLTIKEKKGGKRDAAKIIKKIIAKADLTPEQIEEIKAALDAK